MTITKYEPLNSLIKKFSSHFIDSISRWLVGSSSNNKSGSSILTLLNLIFLVGLG